MGGNFFGRWICVNKGTLAVVGSCRKPTRTLQSLQTGLCVFDSDIAKFSSMTIYATFFNFVGL